MTKFENYNVGAIKDEHERLYGNDLSANKFSTKPFRTAEEISENEGLYGDDPEVSAEEKIYQELDGGADEEIDILDLGKRCNDYFNNKAGRPKNLSEEEAREIALMYCESVAAEDKEEKSRISVKLQKRYTELANLKRGQIAKATPDPKEKVQIDKQTRKDYVSQKREKEIAA